MQLNLGSKIRELRRRDGRTQEALADAIGVTSQAVSRWEANGGYPDMEMIPVIANYFGISIDELFGYENDREKKIDTIIEKIDSFSIKSRGDDELADKCLAIPYLPAVVVSAAYSLTRNAMTRYFDESILYNSIKITAESIILLFAVIYCEVKLLSSL